MTPKAEATEFLKIDKWNHNKLKHFWVSQETINREKRQPMRMGENTANHVPDKRLISREYTV